MDAARTTLANFIINHPNSYKQKELVERVKSLVHDKHFTEPIKEETFPKSGSLICVTKFSRLCQK